jgi:SAM-dependent methyltransferase
MSGAAPTSKRSPAPVSGALDMSMHCPNCKSQGMEIVYGIDNIPVHSTIQLAGHAQALAFPTGNLKLGYCPACAFLGNTLYDPHVQAYSTQCEESQHVSPTFNKFARILAARWIDRYGLRNKTILEVGCGKGEFLGLMCELGDNKGIGIDPSYQPARTPPKMAAKMRFIQDLYSEKYTSIDADCIMCRHTLEHIGQTHEFIAMIRRAIGNRKDITVLFELPDAVRVLKEPAFWDIYYEHCSYFSPGSLARVFRANNFDLLELERDYGDQYLLLAAKPADVPTQPSLPLEDDLAEMAQTVATFEKTVGPAIQSWKNMILTAKEKGEKVVIWSALSKAVAFLTTLKIGNAIEFAVDINPQRHGKFLPITGQQIMAPEFLCEYRPDHVILMNPIYTAEVQKDLDRMGLKAVIHGVGVV